jgi:1,2-diacylglycerol 3-alpha-glucosyltransferase
MRIYERINNKMKPLVFISSFPPRPCGIATFTEEVISFIRKKLPGREIHVICHKDGRGKNVYPLIDLSKENWYEPVAKKIKKLSPYAIHIQHEYGLYDYRKENGENDNNEGFLKLMDMIKEYPVIVEMHTVHGRLREYEEAFIKSLLSKVSITIFKCGYQKWRFEWVLGREGLPLPKNIAVVPHGARPDKIFKDEKKESLKYELGLSELIGKRVAGLVGWIQGNKGWDIILGMWEDLEQIIFGKTGENWILLAAGEVRDPADNEYAKKCLEKLSYLENKGIAKFRKFNPRGNIYYKIMSVCDFIMLPTLDETQSGTLARIIATNRPYVTTAPMEGLTSQTIESNGGVLFTNEESLKRCIIQLAIDEDLRKRLSKNLHWYLEKRVSWEIVTNQYLSLYQMANEAKNLNRPVNIPPTFDLK